MNLSFSWVILVFQTHGLFLSVILVGQTYWVKKTQQLKTNEKN